MSRIAVSFVMGPFSWDSESLGKHRKADGYGEKFLIFLHIHQPVEVVQADQHFPWLGSVRG